MARSTFKVLFYVNGSKEKDGIVPIMGRVTINGTVAQFSCKHIIPKTLWDAKGNRAKGKSAEARNINLALDILRDRLGFNDGIIRRLCEFKEVGIKGELYSSEFNRSFDTRHSVCSIKQGENGKFDFKIDGGSHVSWFRKKMNEFREAIRIPKQRQDRGIKL
ncbi:hypothetical protein HMPREF1068_02854 [Bacteroides nordii CL02T12C05]|mgnify:FL=1|uniref:Arm DNA-binding domain-containing protein n=1 Tax=Bacteroides nordii CL02T12C05 TaxID=997884 RepID=I9S0N1_9BACE|nr:hypothetical protein HMPREF1068_02854 [Bacteroides nordii CL02T12C05]